MFNKKIEPDKIEDWICVYETSVESEARLVQAFLRDQGITCEVLSKKDSAYNVNFGELSSLFLYVPKDQAKDAESSLAEWKKGNIKIDVDDETGSDPANTDENEKDS